MNYLYKFTIIALFPFFCHNTFAQVQDPNSPGFDFTAPDSTLSDSSALGELATHKAGGSSDPSLRAYQRLILSVDSTTNLITYNGVVEQEESGSDSIYSRAKRWAANNLGKEIKIELDKRNQKLVYIGGIPAYIYMNKYSKRLIGRFEFKVTFLIKEGRYKYQITNLVHETIKPSDGSKSVRNYFEYYYTSATHVRENDIILRNADKDILRMVAGIRAALGEPRLVDEDDW